MAGNFNISRFKSAISARGGLSRGLFFECGIQVIQQTSNGSENVFQLENELLVCKTANLPTETVDTIELKYHTRSIRIPGSRQYQPLTLTFYNTNDYLVLDKFKRWLDKINRWDINQRDTAEINAQLDIYGSLQLFQYNNNGQMSAKDLLNVAVNTGIAAGERLASGINPLLGTVGNAIGNQFVRPIDSNNPVIGTYKFNFVYPSSISGLQFSYDDDGTYQTFDVEFQYLHMEFIKGRVTSVSGTANLLSKVGL